MLFQCAGYSRVTQYLLASSYVLFPLQREGLRFSKSGQLRLLAGFLGCVLFVSCFFLFAACFPSHPQIMTTSTHMVRRPWLCPLCFWSALQMKYFSKIFSDVTSSVCFVGRNTVSRLPPPPLQRSCAPSPRTRCLSSGSVLGCSGVRSVLS